MNGPNICEAKLWMGVLVVSVLRDIHSLTTLAVPIVMKMLRDVVWASPRRTQECDVDRTFVGWSTIQVGICEGNVIGQDELNAIGYSIYKGIVSGQCQSRW